MGHDGHGHDDDHGHGHGHHGHGPRTVDQHRSQSAATVSAFVITCSDTRNATTDEGGALVRTLLEQAGHQVLGAVVVKDDPTEIRRAVEGALEKGARAVLITGGTGISRRDVTIETITPMLERKLRGFGELFRMLSYEEIGSAAMLSRAAAGLIHGSVVFAMPGSPQAVKLAMEKLILPELGHVVREATR